MHVEAEHVETPSERVRNRSPRLGRREPELRAVMTGDDRLVRVCVDAERHADEHALDTRSRSEGNLVGSVDDDGSSLPCRFLQKRPVLVVPVHDERGPGESGGTGEPELARRGDVGTDALLGQHPEHGDIRKCLRSVEDAPALADGASQRAGLFAQRLLAVDDERRTESLCEVGRRDPTEPELAVLHTRRLREEIEHPRILPGTVFAREAASSIVQGPSAA